MNSYASIMDIIKTKNKRKNEYQLSIHYNSTIFLNNRIENRSKVTIPIVTQSYRIVISGVRTVANVSNYENKKTNIQSVYITLSCK